MSRRLFVVNTLFQLMTAINLNLKVFSDGDNDIFITDCSVGAEKIAENLKNECIFSNVYYILTEEKIQTKTVKDKVRRFIEYFFEPNQMFDNIVPDISYAYDELLFYNYDTLVTYIFNKILKENNNASWSRFEEGYISYFYGEIESRIVMLSEKIHCFFKRENSMAQHCDSYYFYEPNLVLFNKDYKIKKIPKIDKNDSKIIQHINNTFGITDVPDEYKSVKYIFFEEQFSFDNSGVEDYELISKICEAVGKENILVKMHPRNRKNRFLNDEIKTNKTIGIPWEVIHLNRSFENKVFVAISCGSILSSKILFSESVKSILLYKCVNKCPPLVNEKYEIYIKKLCDLYGTELIVPENMEQAIEILKTMEE